MRSLSRHDEESAAPGVCHGLRKYFGSYCAWSASNTNLTNTIFTMSATPQAVESTAGGVGLIVSMAVEVLEMSGFVAIVGQFIAHN